MECNDMTWHGLHDMEPHGNTSHGMKCDALEWHDMIEVGRLGIKKTKTCN